MLDGCDGAEEECWDEFSKNEGAAARATANHDGRLRIVLTMSWERERRVRREREQMEERRGTLGDIEESATDSEEEDRNGG